MDEKKQRPWNLATRIAIAIVLSPLLYLLSVGPAARIYIHTPRGSVPDSIVNAYLEPARKIDRAFPGPLQWYADLFMF